jgi:vancomycin permeability regulator SanA
VNAPTTRRPRRRIVRRILLFAAAVAVLAPVTVHETVRSYARGHVYSADTAPQAPVAIVLGAAVGPGGWPREHLGARLRAAARLFDRGVVDRILVSGAGYETDYDEPGAMSEMLVALGVPQDRIDRDPLGLRTLDSMVRAAETFGVRRALVVSQDWHLARALFLGRVHAGLDCDGVRAPLEWAEPPGARDDPTADGPFGVPLREVAARLFAWVDVYVLGTRPRAETARPR